jgi:hypothetical protein
MMVMGYFLKGGLNVTKEKQGRELKEAAKDEVLSRRAAIKRIAAGLAGAGVVVVAGLICQEKPYGDSVKLPYSDAIPSQPAPPSSGPKYGDAVKLPYRDKAPN